jgi:hypothetical protein
MRPKHELADIVRLYGSGFEANHKVHPEHGKVLRAIKHCRTSVFGGHIEQCSDCGDERIAYNSCRNRHCPKCQGTQRDKWIEARKKDLLNCRYFHVVFTLPQSLNVFCMHYPKELYGMFFSASKETLTTFGRDEKYLGADIGGISVLHTWGQNLSLHPHVHIIVSGGGITKSGEWKTTRTGGKYLFPVKAMSAVFRGKFMGYFKGFMEGNGMEMTSELHRDLYKKDWVVYAKRPFGGAEQVIEYLGRYTHKIAISNHRLKNVEEGKVTFSYKDYRDGGKTKEMTLDASEFLRRFCMHILPRGFRKIRHYGILSSVNKRKIREYQSQEKTHETHETKPAYYSRFSKEETTPQNLCPCCKKGVMRIVMSFLPNAPPWGLRHKTEKKQYLKHTQP